MTASTAILPPAPGRFSTRKFWPTCSDSHWHSSRATTSGAPPALKPMTICTGRAGKASARARRAATGSAVKPAARPRRLRREGVMVTKFSIELDADRFHQRRPARDVLLHELIEL